MAHNHGAHEGSSNVRLAFLLNFSFAILEVIGGILTNSTAILSDAVHDFSDSLALGISVIFEKFSDRNPTERHTYGLKRLSLIGAFINITVLSIGTYYVVIKAIESFINPEPVKAMGMLALAIFGVFINGLSVYRMKGAKKILDKTVIMHLMEDLLGWVAVLVVSIVIYFTQWYILDSILSFLIALVIIRNIYLNIKSAISIIMQSVPDQEVYGQIKEAITNLENITEIRESNMWTLDGEEHVFTATIAIEKTADTEQILTQIKDILEQYEVHTSTIEMTSATNSVHSCTEEGELGHGK